MAQFVTHADDVPPFMSAKMLFAVTVFGVLVMLLKVSVFSLLTDQVPVNVQTLKTFFGGSVIAREFKLLPGVRVFSTVRTTLAIRATAGRVNEIRSGITHSGSTAFKAVYVLMLRIRSRGRNTDQIHCFRPV